MLSLKCGRAKQTPTVKDNNMHDPKVILAEFIEWAENCGEDSFYIFDYPEEAIERFLKTKQDGNSED